MADFLYTARAGDPGSGFREALRILSAPAPYSPPAPQPATWDDWLAARRKAR